MDPISVELRLALDMFKGDVEKAEAYVKQKLGNASYGGVSNAKQASDADKMASSAQAASRTAADVISRVSKAMGGNILGKEGGSSAFWAKNPHLLQTGAAPLGGLPAVATMKEQNKLLQDRAKFMKDMTFLMMPLMNPGSVWATLFSTRQAFSAFTQTGMGRGMVGGTLGGAALATAALVAASTAVGVALKALQMTIKGVIDSFEKARRSYATALMSGGLPLSFTVRRTQLASVLGVSEKEVFQFGRQISYLNDRLAWSGNIIAQTTPALAGVGWEFRIIRENLSALFADLAMKFAPQAMTFGEGVNVLIKAMDRLVNSGAFKALMMMEATFSSAGGIRGLVSLLGQKMGTPSSIDRVPPPLAYMKQLPVSAWEKMGLVIGGFGGTNPAQQTAQNTKRTVEELKALRQGLVPRSGAEFFNPAFSNP